MTTFQKNQLKCIRSMATRMYENMPDNCETAKAYKREAEAMVGRWTLHYRLPDLFPGTLAGMRHLIERLRDYETVAEGEFAQQTAEQQTELLGRVRTVLQNLISFCTGVLASEGIGGVAPHVCTVHDEIQAEPGVSALYYGGKRITDAKDMAKAYYGKNPDDGQIRRCKVLKAYLEEVYDEGKPRIDLTKAILGQFSILTLEDCICNWPCKVQDVKVADPGNLTPQERKAMFDIYNAYLDNSSPWCDPEEQIIIID